MKIKAYSVKQEGGKAEPFYFERKIGKRDVVVGSLRFHNWRTNNFIHCYITNH